MVGTGTAGVCSLIFSYKMQSIRIKCGVEMWMWKGEGRGEGRLGPVGGFGKADDRCCWAKKKC